MTAALAAVTRLRPVGLAELDAHAALQHRTDRKYLLHEDRLAAVLGALPATWAHLQMDGRHTTTYRTAYVDTADLACWRAHAQGRRLRWKARTRSYVEDGLHRFEVKTKDGRGRTVKVSVRVDRAGGGELSGRAHALLRETVGEVPALRPGTRVSCVRATLADLQEGSRLTVDAALRGELHGRALGVRPGMLVVETKGGLTPGSADRALLAAGVRPVSVSKYQLLTAALHGGLVDNDHRAVRRRLLADLTDLRAAA